MFCIYKWYYMHICNVEEGGRGEGGRGREREARRGAVLENYGEVKIFIFFIF